MLEAEQSLVDKLVLLCNLGGIPSDDPREVAGVLRYHLEQMKLLDRNSIEFLVSLEAAKTLDRQVRELEARLLCPEGYLWVQQIS